MGLSRLMLYTRTILISWLATHLMQPKFSGDWTVPQRSQNMRLGNLIWSAVLQDVVHLIASLMVIWNMLLHTGKWIQMCLVGGATTGLRKASQVRHLVRSISSNFCILVFRSSSPGASSIAVLRPLGNPARIQLRLSGPAHLAWSCSLGCAWSNRCALGRPQTVSVVERVLAPRLCRLLLPIATSNHKRWNQTTIVSSLFWFSFGA
jgi:hypothetical protein